jgi:NADH:ubiquinone oxidoreductase subunit E
MRAMTEQEQTQTKEKEILTNFSELNDLIDLYWAGRKDCLIQILHTAQNIYGYLPVELQEFIAEKMDMPLSEVAGVISFYSFFSVKKRGLHTIRTCLGTACYVRGGKKVVDHLIKKLEIQIGETTADGKFTLEIARCIGACGLAPAIMIDNEVYKQMTPSKIDALLKTF